MALEIDEKQVLLFRPTDNDYGWHARVLFLPLAEPGTWIGCTPAHEFEVVSLTKERVRVLPRGMVTLPPVVDDAGTLLFEALEPGELESLRLQARQYLEVLGLQPTAPVTATVPSHWRFADTAHADFGSEVPAGVVDDSKDFVSKGGASLVRVGGEWTFAELVVDAKVDLWKAAKLCGAIHDDRLLEQLPATVHSLAFPAALSKADFKAKVPGWPLSDERVALEFTEGIRASGFTFLSHHLDFVSKSGLSRGSGTCRTHRRISEALGLLLQSDRLNVLNLAGTEFLMEYLVQVEQAVKRNPKAPDFSFMDEYLATGVDESGAVVVPKFQHHVSSQQRDRATTMKQQRLWAEELGYTHRGAASSGGGFGGGGGSRGGGGGGGGRGDGNQGGGGGGAAGQPPQGGGRGSRRARGRGQRATGEGDDD